MKKYIFLLLFTLLGTVGYSQALVREGNVFKASTTKVAKSGGVKTGFLWEDSKGNQYPVFVSPKGACYVKRVSKKTGKEYKQYLPKEVQIEIRKELGIPEKEEE